MKIIVEKVGLLFLITLMILLIIINVGYWYTPPWYSESVFGRLTKVFSAAMLIAATIHSIKKYFQL